MRILMQLGAVAVVALAGSLLVGAVSGVAVLVLLFGLATAVLALLTYAWVVRRTERREPAEVARAGAGPAFGRGLLIGAGAFAAVIAVIALFGGYHVHGWGSASGALAALGLSAAAATTEELLFRGILFRHVERWIGTWGALVLTGLLFGLMHLFNVHASLWGGIAIAIEAGAMLAAAYAATRTLWLPIGLHLAWNFAEGGLFGTDVSGTDGTRGLLDASLSGPTALSGGAFGPEASLFAVLAGTALTVTFLVLARRQGRIGTRAATLVP